jgi:hypothetical protein
MGSPKKVGLVVGAACFAPLEQAANATTASNAPNFHTTSCPLKISA